MEEVSARLESQVLTSARRAAPASVNFALCCIANATVKTGKQIGPPPADLKRVADSSKIRSAQGYRHAGARDRPEVEWPRRRQWSGAASKTAGGC